MCTLSILARRRTWRWPQSTTLRLREQSTGHKPSRPASSTTFSSLCGPHTTPIESKRCIPSGCAASSYITGNAIPRRWAALMYASGIHASGNWGKPRRENDSSSSRRPVKRPPLIVSAQALANSARGLSGGLFQQAGLPIDSQHQGVDARADAE